MAVSIELNPYGSGVRSAQQSTLFSMTSVISRNDDISIAHYTFANETPSLLPQLFQFAIERLEIPLPNKKSSLDGSTDVLGKLDVSE
jgi:hypothetical protein